MANVVTAALSILVPKSMKKGGTALTGTTTPANATSILAMPAYQDHLTDIYSQRQSSDSRTLMKALAKNDPDVSAAFNAYLTIAGADLPTFLAKDLTGQIDLPGMQLLQQTLLLITQQFDYTQGFDYQPSLMTLCENMRYMLLMTGAIAAELVFDKNLAPTSIRFVDPLYLFWYEKIPGQYKPEQRQAGQFIDLDIPSFFVGFHHKDPTAIYTVSPFVSAINTIAARQQVINDLYRIMRITGYPRMDVSVMEEVIMKSAPADVKKSAPATRQWLNDRMSEISSSITNIRPDQAFIHWDSIQAKTTNEKAAMAMDITPVINTLNGQNQAALKIMATVIGRGESGVNTASVEARVFSMNCDELNKPVAEVLANMLTLALRVQGFQGYVECKFDDVELRPDYELEPQKTMRASRLKEDLSLGLITDMEYHLQIYRRPPPDGSPVLQGTGFMQQQTTSGNPDDKPANPTGGANASSTSTTNSVGRASTTPGSKSAASNTVKSPPKK
jgi:hypothetical protein